MRFEILARCSTTRARVSRLTLAHGETALPTFMPVATQAALKGLTAEQVEALGVTLLLNNTYHLNLRPGVDILRKAGGAHAFQGWRKNLLTDSGGFQLVSLSKFTTITEEGALFASPFTGEPTMLTPEESIKIQHAIGADIIMQLDDVVPSLTTGPRVEEAMLRSVRWLDRCIAAHRVSPENLERQELFAIIQGGLDQELRARCLEAMVARKDEVSGFAVGGLSGGEEKDVFWQIIKQCCDALPADRPRYAMGVGFAEDLIVCIALGIDMADCVFPTRTARFGVALTFDGPLNTRLSKYSSDLSPLTTNCPCPTCKSKVSRALLHSTLASETSAAHALTMHNVVFQAQLVGKARDAILEDRFPEYCRAFFKRYFAGRGIPGWCVDAMTSVGVGIVEEGTRVVRESTGANWDRPALDSRT